MRSVTQAISPERASVACVFRDKLDARKTDYVDLLAALCRIRCGSEMLDGVEKAVKLVESHLSALQLSVSRRDGDPFAPHLIATTNVKGPQIVLGGHLDTTFTDYDDLPQFHVDGGYAVGPGTADMKGGIVVFLAALECLDDIGLLHELPLTIIFNTDEERGAATSYTLWQELAKNAKAALFSECAGRSSEIIVSRRAQLSYRLNVTGHGAHNGTSAAGKASALVELAHKIIAIEALNDRFDDTSINVGYASAGIANSTVLTKNGASETATAQIDIRYPTPELEAPIRAAMQEIIDDTTVDGCKSTLQQTIFRPAWPRSSSSDRLSALTRSIARDLGQGSIGEEERGSTADSNWFGAVGVPCIDGLGPVGFDDHTPSERIILSTLNERALLVATLLASLAEW